MKKASVVTLYGDRCEQNIGNSLQSYALCTVLKNLGCKSSLIYFAITNRKQRFILMLKKIKWFLFRMNIQAKKRKALFCKFYSGIKVKTIKKDMKYKKNTYYICGSDQIWNPSFAGTPELFAYGADDGRRIAYAASIGVDELSKDTKKRYSKYLQGMKYISVREEAAARLVHEMTGKNVPVLCDPTMLLSKREWEAISKKAGFKTDKYILTYFLGEVSPEYKDYISALAEGLGCGVINLEKMKPNDYWYSVGPAEFIWLVNNCRMMCTDSFHGSVFSILMQKPFLVFERLGNEMSMNSRLDTLLKKTGLKSRVFVGQTLEEAINIDYKNVLANIESEKEKAIDYLKNALGVE